MVLGHGFGILLIVAGATLAGAALAENDVSYLIGAAGCVVLWVITAPPPLKLCSDALVTRPLFSRPVRHELGDVRKVIVGKVREGHGYSGYSGFAVVLERRDGNRITIQQSQHCGRRRLLGWAQAIAECRGFDGDLQTSDRLIRGGRS